MIITKRSHPSLHMVFQTIALDHGFVNRESPEFVGDDYAIQIPDAYAADVPVVERQLADLPDSDLDTLCCGEVGEQRAIVELYRLPASVQRMLEGYFNAWEEVA